MGIIRNLQVSALVVFGAAILTSAGCLHAPAETSEYTQGPAPRRMPSPAEDGECKSYEDSLTGGQVFTMYCSYCHNAPSLAERNFANFKNVSSHMRVRANLTGKEYAKLVEFFRRWNDVPERTPPPETSPKRLIYSQPINELRDQPQANVAPAAMLPPADQPKAKDSQPKDAK
jgi:hypothetical protein